jgi:hypothetical protein
VPGPRRKPARRFRVHPARSEKWPRKAFLRFYGLCQKYLGFRFAPVHESRLGLASGFHVEFESPQDLVRVALCCCGARNDAVANHQLCL